MPTTVIKTIIRKHLTYIGAIQKVCHRPRGGGGSSKIVTKCDKGGRGVKQKSDVTTSKKYRFNNYIRMTLKVVITPPHLLFNVAFHVNNKV